MTEHRFIYTSQEKYDHPNNPISRERLVEIYDFVERQGTKISAAVAGGGIVSAPFLDGRLDKVVGTVGVAAFCYSVLRIYRSRRDGRNSGNNNESENK